MVFASTTFLFLFIPITTFLYFFSNNYCKNFVLLVTSLFFYFWGGPRYTWIMIASILVNYILGIFLQGKYAKIFLTVGIIFNLLLLVVFKYSGFVVENLNSVIPGVQIPNPNIILPVGISFYTFQSLSYLIDVYRKEVQAQKNLLHYSMYISLFPQLIAGPIVRYSHIANEIKNRNSRFCDLVYGSKRFVIGLSKKVLIANNVALVADGVS